MRIDGRESEAPALLPQAEPRDGRPGRGLRGLYAQAGGQNKVDAGAARSPIFGARAQDIGTDAMFTIGNTLFEQRRLDRWRRTTDPRDVYSGDRTGGLA